MVKQRNWQWMFLFGLQALLILACLPECTEQGPEYSNWAIIRSTGQPSQTVNVGEPFTINPIVQFQRGVTSPETTFLISLFLDNSAVDCSPSPCQQTYVRRQSETAYFKFTLILKQPLPESVESIGYVLDVRTTTSTAAVDAKAGKIPLRQPDLEVYHGAQLLENHAKITLDVEAELILRNKGSIPLTVTDINLLNLWGSNNITLKQPFDFTPVPPGQSRRVPIDCPKEDTTQLSTLIVTYNFGRSSRQWYTGIVCTGYPVGLVEVQRGGFLVSKDSRVSINPGVTPFNVVLTNNTAVSLAGLTISPNTAGLFQVTSLDGVTLSAGQRQTQFTVTCSPNIIEPTLAQVQFLYGKFIYPFEVICQPSTGGLAPLDALPPDGGDDINRNPPPIGGEVPVDQLPTEEVPQPVGTP